MGLVVLESLANILEISQTIPPSFGRQRLENPEARVREHTLEDYFRAGRPFYGVI